jgi:hypothetical protein
MFVLSMSRQRNQAAATRAAAKVVPKLFVPIRLEGNFLLRFGRGFFGCPECVRGCSFTASSQELDGLGGYFV